MAGHQHNLAPVRYTTILAHDFLVSSLRAHRLKGPPSCSRPRQASLAISNARLHLGCRAALNIPLLRRLLATGFCEFSRTAQTKCVRISENDETCEATCMKRRNESLWHAMHLVWHESASHSSAGCLPRILQLRAGTQTLQTPAVLLSLDTVMEEMTQTRDKHARILRQQESPQIILPRSQSARLVAAGGAEEHKPLFHSLRRGQLAPLLRKVGVSCSLGAVRNTFLVCDRDRVS